MTGAPGTDRDGNPADPAPRPRWAARLAVGLALGLLTLLAFGLWADVDRLGDAARSFAWPLFPGVLLLALANYALRWVRWELYLRAAGIAVPRSLSVGVFASGLAMSITPGKLGEVLKTALLHQDADVPVARSFPVVVTERLADLAAVILLAAAGAAGGGGHLGIVLGAVGLTAAMFAVLATRPGLKVVFGVLGLAVRRKVSGGAVDEALSVQKRLLSPGLVAAGVALGALAWFAEAAGLWLVVRGFPQGAAALGAITFTYMVGSLAGALSFLPGGLVATEATLAVMLAAQAFPGVEPATADTLAIAATLLIRLATLWFAVLLGGAGLLWIAARRRATAPSRS